MIKITSRILGCGSALPKRAISNEELSKTVDTTDEWIRSRTGIEQRYIVGEGETTATLATEAAREAIENSGLKPEDIDLIVVATASPDFSFPGVSSLVQKELGIGKAAAFDLQAACSGFVHGLGVTNSMIQTGMHKNALVIGAETFSHFLDWEDRTTCVLFGDGAGAVVLQRDEEGRGVSHAMLSGDGKYAELLYANGGISSSQTPGKIYMNGREVYKHAVREMSAAVKSLLEKNNISADKIKFLIPHQANKRIIDAVADSIDFNHEKIIYTMDKHANTSAASIPLALDFASKSGKLEDGEIILFIAFGAGFSWGAALATWG